MDLFQTVIEQTPPELLPSLLHPARAKGLDALRALGQAMAHAPSTTRAGYKTGETSFSLPDLCNGFLSMQVQKGHVDQALALYEGLDYEGSWIHQSPVIENMHHRVLWSMMEANLSKEQVDRVMSGFKIPPEKIHTHVDADKAMHCKSALLWLTENHPKALKGVFGNKANKRHALMLGSVGMESKDAVQAMLNEHPLWQSFTPDAARKRNDFLVEVLIQLKQNKNTESLFQLSASSIASCGNREGSLSPTHLDPSRMDALLGAGPSPLLDCVHDELLSVSGICPGLSSTTTMLAMIELGLPLDQFRNPAGDNYLHCAVHAHQERCEPWVRTLVSIYPNLAFVPNNEGDRPIDLLERLNVETLSPLITWARSIHSAFQQQELDQNTHPSPTKTSSLRL